MNVTRNFVYKINYKGHLEKHATNVLILDMLDTENRYFLNINIMNIIMLKVCILVLPVNEPGDLFKAMNVM